MLLPTRDWPGLVLKICDRRHRTARRGTEGKVLFEVGAGEPWDRLCPAAVAANCAGVECLSGIPGSVGGTPVQNVGAYGQEVSETIESVQVFDLRKHNQLRELCNGSLRIRLPLRASSTPASMDRFVVLRVTYALALGGAPRLEYADLKRHFEDKPSSHAGGGS